MEFISVQMKRAKTIAALRLVGRLPNKSSDSLARREAGHLAKLFLFEHFELPHGSKLLSHVFYTPTVLGERHSRFFSTVIKRR